MDLPRLKYTKLDPVFCKKKGLSICLRARIFFQGHFGHFWGPGRVFFQGLGQFSSLNVLSFRNKVTAVFVRGVFSKGEVRGSN